MTDSRERQRDQRFDEVLRACGPDLPEPEAGQEVRASFGELLGSPETADERPALEAAALGAGGGSARRKRSLHNSVYAITACVILLAAVNAYSFHQNQQLREQLIRLQGRLNARPLTPLVPQDPSKKRIIDRPVSGMPRWVVVNLHRNGCPWAKEVTPWIQKLSEELGDSPLMFVTLDLSAQRVKEAVRQAKFLGLDYVFDKDPGQETGVVKIVDTRRDLVVHTAAGPQALPELREAIDKARAGLLARS